ncbi:hypothetical protein BV22DRAFT_1122097 [Leucogyrophana mollusca]|uniref:Uncharacterized protein n=1 Tax=Leucogyrophana mollusca TaxID=85980 RepID=A0ACB8B7J6_9AGAM|nr:hypothetical protein BV22DRAFT_1122097 [Leucogyrophana mollusca]
MDMDSMPGSPIVDYVRPSTKERVQAVDPNEGRCLVENCSPTSSIEYCYLLSRKHWHNTGLLDSLEWYWNMRANTLNLDTRRNIFPAGASVHHMHDTGRWLLLPEDAIVQQYYDTLALFHVFAVRERFPVIPDRNDFRYRLVPIKDMKGIAFTRQHATPVDLSPDDFTVRVYPFDTLPVLVSHIHPKFAIVAAGMRLSTLQAEDVSALADAFPILPKIVALYRAWTGPCPANAQENDSFWPPYNPSDDDADDDDDRGDEPRDKDYNDAVTEKGRYRSKTRNRARDASPTENRTRTRGANQRPGQTDGADDMRDRDSDSAVTKKGRYNGGHRKRRRRRNWHESTGSSGDAPSASGKRTQSGGLSRATVAEHTCKVGKMEWSGDALLTWSRQC